jgi:hypothetical protein
MVAEDKVADYGRTIGEVVYGFSDRAVLESPPGLWDRAIRPNRK